MPRPELLLLSDLLARRVRDAQGGDQGIGVLGWMHPPVHRLLGWASRPSNLSQHRCIWRLDQLEGLQDHEVLVRGAPADTDAATLERLPTLLGALLFGSGGDPLARLVDAAVEWRSGRIDHYLVARSDPRLPGGSRWRLAPDRILDQRPGEVFTALEGLGDLPLAQASLRESLLRRSRRWRDQWGEETSRWREQWQQASGRLEERLEGWLEESPWQEPIARRPESVGEHGDIWPEEPWPLPVDPASNPEADPAADPDVAAASPRVVSHRPAARAGASAPEHDDPVGAADAWDDGEDWGEAAWPPSGAPAAEGRRQPSSRASGRAPQSWRPQARAAQPGAHEPGHEPGEDDPWV